MPFYKIEIYCWKEVFPLKLFSKNMKRITAAVLSALLLCAAPLSYADDTVADMEAKQTELANKKADLENKISSLESQEADKAEYLTLDRKSVV